MKLWSTEKSFCIVYCFRLLSSIGPAINPFMRSCAGYDIVQLMGQSTPKRKEKKRTNY